MPVYTQPAYAAPIQTYSVRGDKRARGRRRREAAAASAAPPVPHFGCAPWHAARHALSWPASGGWNASSKPRP